MENRKLKVVWICSFSNKKVRAKLPIKVSGCKKLVYKLMGRTISKDTDSAIWNTNAIEEFEKIKDVDLYVICPVRDLVEPIVAYKEDNIHYYFFREQHSNLIRFVFYQLFTEYTSHYKTNRRFISRFIKDIKPDIVHVMGAENPFYSLSLLDIPSDIPTIIQLQALLTRLVDKTQDKLKKRSYYYKGLIEREIIMKANYIGTISEVFRQYIVKEINPDAVFLDLTLAMAQKINLDQKGKKYDFVYFSANINKAGREAIESFALACEKNKDITLDIVGEYYSSFKEELDERIKELGLGKNITFEGRLPTHEDVICQIRKSRFALIPLKLDLVPNTIHEAMANGLPVVTTITDGTPSLNAKRQCVLLSEQNDFQAMADNMIALLDNEQLGNELRWNAAAYEEERSNNRSIIEKWVEAYKSIVKP